MVEIEVGKKAEGDVVSVQEKRSYLSSIPDNLPVLPLRNAVMFPYTVLKISVAQARSLKLLDDLKGGNKLLAVVAYKNAKYEIPSPDQVHRIGSLAQILRVKPNTETGVDLLLQGLDKIRVCSWVSEEPYLQATVCVVNDIEPEIGDIEAEAVRLNLVQQFQSLASMISYLPEQLVQSVSQMQDYRQLAYLIVSSIRTEVKDAQAILEQDDVLAKMLKLTDLVNHEIEVFELGKKIQSEARTEMEKAQRDYVLRQQLKAIRKELGEETDSQVKIEDYQEKIKASGMGAEAKRKAESELQRLERLPEASSEYNVILTYLDWLVALPWNKSTKDELDILNAKKILDEDHYGLEKIKERIIEYLAVRLLKKKREGEFEKNKGVHSNKIRRQREGVILCLAGPPGIGKTSLGRSIARSLGRKLQRISLGGVRDEAEIRGHRRTYIGAMPGRFITALRNAETNNPIILLDEVDKLGSDWQGDPASALLEVLDPEQNREFRDHYMEVAFDLSQLMFIATANVAENIPGPLLDRMETLRLPGYTDDEKLHIAQRYLLVRQKQENGLKPDELKLDDEAVLRVIREYTREAGVRNLDRKIGAICRKIAVKIARDAISDFQVEQHHVEDLLGKPMYVYDIAARTRTPGVATGLAVTSVGGDILFVEVSRSPGKKGLTVTGQLGDVMRESAETAVSFVRAHTESLGIATDFYDKTDLHIHLPAGAIPKDGPSAGITLVVALVSLLTNRPVRMDVGMTGEITLRGLVLPVGGIKDKVLAAHRAKLTTVILPSHNGKDLDDLPETVRASMKFVLAEKIETVIENALA